MSKSDGGSAFPNVNGFGSGMTLRDWFAGQALSGCQGTFFTEVPEKTAEMAYKYADAMIAERSK